jgi:hypothetical protein
MSELFVEVLALLTTIWILSLLTVLAVVIDKDSK